MRKHGFTGILEDIMSAEKLRQAIAWIVLAGFVLFSTIAGFYYGVGIGFAVLGITCGITALLVGNDN